MTVEPESDGVAELADADLVLRTRSGDPAAFGELWRRHYRSGITVARSVSASLDADDLVQEAYTRIYQSILKGGGPTGSFRAYLFTAIRNTAAGWGRARRETAIDALDTVEDPATTEQATADALDRGLTHQAFRSLPTRWQEVLWYSEIEQMKPAEIAPLLGMKPTAVAQLAFRAREGLREAWIQAHLRSVADGSMCQWTIERLGAYARDNLGRRDRGKLDAHLADCPRCAIVAGEAKEVSSRLALVLLPLTIGAAGAAGYLATLQGAAVPVLALAAMPSAVVQGAVTAVPAAAGAAAGSAAGAGSASGAAGGGSAAAASGGGVFAGMGAAASLVAAGMVVVGAVVAAAVVLPSVTPAVVAAETPSVIQPVDRVDPVIADEAPTDVEPDVVAPSPVPTTPADPPAAAPAPPQPSDPVDPVDLVDPVDPIDPVDPVDPIDPIDPVDPVDPTDPTDPTDPVDPSDPTDPVDPSDPTDPTDPALPSGTPEVGDVSLAFDGTTLTATVGVRGDAGATVRLTVAGAERTRSVLGEDGSGAVSFEPTIREVVEDAPVELQYVTDTEAGTPLVTTMTELLGIVVVVD